jgi:uncharacterized YigZ family protein
LDNLFFVEQEFSSIFEVKKSKFLSFFVPYNNFKEKLEYLKLEHPKSRHIVWAYRYVNEFGQIVENSTDDGEPKGVAGKPTLKVMAGHGIVNSAILTVRYFGGIKLGMGGMVRAYSDSANCLFELEDIELLEYKELYTKKIEIEYNQLSIIEYKVKNIGLEIKNIEYTDKIVMTLEGTKEQISIEL